MLRELGDSSNHQKQLKLAIVDKIHLCRRHFIRFAKIAIAESWICRSKGMASALGSPFGQSDAKSINFLHACVASRLAFRLLATPRPELGINLRRPSLPRHQIAILTISSTRDPPWNHHPHRHRCARTIGKSPSSPPPVVAMSTLGRCPSRPSTSHVSNGPPLRRSTPGRRVLPPTTGASDVEEDISGNP
jgi:hypothetical protein